MALSLNYLRVFHDFVGINDHEVCWSSMAVLSYMGISHLPLFACLLPYHHLSPSQPYLLGSNTLLPLSISITKYVTITTYAPPMYLYCVPFDDNNGGITRCKLLTASCEDSELNGHYSCCMPTDLIHKLTAFIIAAWRETIVKHCSLACLGKLVICEPINVTKYLIEQIVVMPLKIILIRSHGCWLVILHNFSVNRSNLLWLI